jgi:3-isopropylmalate/(R)-2-methylmalate dehydratase large subunit
MTGMTITEKILARAAGRERVEPGECVMAKVDGLVLSDLGTHRAVNMFREMGGARVWDPSKVFVILDHDVPPSNARSAENCAIARRFAREQGIRLYDIGRTGIQHVIAPEEGLVLPGDVFVAGDSHTTTLGAVGAFATGINGPDIALCLALGEVWFRVPETIRYVYTGALRPWVSPKDLILHTIGRVGTDGALYRAMEYAGPVVEALSMEGRLTICNMAIEAGAKNGVVPADAVTAAYCRPRARRPFQLLRSDVDARYADVLEIDCSRLAPQVALPSSPGNVRGLDEIAGQAIDQVYIGSCTNARIEDLRIVARILGGRKVHPEVRCIVVPGSYNVYNAALAEGLVSVFAEAGAAVGPPTCGACYGGHLGIAAAGDRVVSTTNRNFRGRMGHPEAQVFLASPAVAAAAAVAGRLVPPEEVAGDA